MRYVGSWIGLGVLLWGTLTFVTGCDSAKQKGANPAAFDKAAKTPLEMMMEEEKGSMEDEYDADEEEDYDADKEYDKGDECDAEEEAEAAPGAPVSTTRRPMLPAPQAIHLRAAPPPLMNPIRPDVLEAPPDESSPDRSSVSMPVTTKMHKLGAAKIDKPGAPKMMTASRNEEPSATSSTPSPDGKYTVVRVFYGTDRAAVAAGSLKKPLYYQWLLYTVGAAGATLVLVSFAFYFWARWWTKALAGLGLAATLVLGVLTGYVATQGKMPGATAGEESTTVAYGPQRGELELGVCEVSIPKEHEVGELESPSVLRLEFREDPKKHVVLLSAARQPAEEFFDQLRKCVGRSSQKSAFVFVHGFNVTFEDAARRTAQIAYDLKFDGAPVFYSWPSQASLWRYTVDETNAAWTVPHLKRFLTDLAEQSGARQIHLIAHSMGNRALTSALRDLAFLPESSRPKFTEVLLTAPDIDAEVFQSDIAPALTKTARRITLYASSNDEALVFSKTVHGYPRAGDSGDKLLIVPGVETIDVSAIDTSLIGHSYYGDNGTVLADIFEVLHEAKPPSQRTWLREAYLGLKRYWVFRR